MAASRVFVSYAHDSAEHQERVRQFTDFLRGAIGLDAHMDAYDDSVRRDWSLWATEHLQEADFIVVIASPMYKRRAEGKAPPHEGRGSQFEAAIIRNFLTQDLSTQTQRILPVILRGGRIEDIPTFLNPYSTTRFHVDDLTKEGVSDLVRAITGQSKYPKPPLRQWQGAPTGPVLVAGMAWSSNENTRAATATIGSKPYEHSIVARVTATDAMGFVEVDLDGRFTWLTATVGMLDDADEPFQMGRFRVVVDGRTRAEYDTSYGKSVTVKAALAGARKLRLEMYRPSTTTGWQATGGPSALAWANPQLLT